MLPDSAFAAWCSRRKLSHEAIEILQQIRTSRPIRKVPQNKAAIPNTFSSKKMERAIQFELYSVEFPFIYEAEHDDDILEFWCQPSTFEISYAGANGRLMRHPHTPDYFVIHRDSAGWIDVKDQGMLVASWKKQPNRYRMVEGVWTFPPGKLYAEELGLTYSLLVSAEANAIPAFLIN